MISRQNNSRVIIVPLEVWKVPILYFELMLLLALPDCEFVIHEVSYSVHDLPVSLPQGVPRLYHAIKRLQNTQTEMQAFQRIPVCL